MYVMKNVMCVGGGGVWSDKDCGLVTSSTGQLQCRCLHSGTYAVIDVSVCVSVCV